MGGGEAEAGMSCGWSLHCSAAFAATKFRGLLKLSVALNLTMSRSTKDDVCGKLYIR
jgi:hypothetical protein